MAGKGRGKRAMPRSAAATLDRARRLIVRTVSSAKARSLAVTEP